MLTYKKDNIHIEVNNKNQCEVFIKVADSVINEDIALALTYKEYKAICESLPYIQEMKEVVYGK